MVATSDDFGDDVDHDVYWQACIALIVGEESDDLEKCGKEEDGGNFDEQKHSRIQSHSNFRVGYDHGPQVPDPRLGQVFVCKTMCPLKNSLNDKCT